MYMENSAQNTSLESTVKVGTFSGILAMSSLIPQFLKYGEFELMFSQNTLQKYDECLRWVVRDIGDMPVTEINQFHFTDLKQKITARGSGTSRVASMVFSMKSFLRYCNDFLELPVMDYKKIRSPRIKRRDVIYLTNEEITQFIDSIKIENHSNSKTWGVWMACVSGSWWRFCWAVVCAFPRLSPLTATV